jgi:hypothetical protein
MISFRRRLQKNKLIQTLATLKITVVCLALLFILTFWGTVAQVQQGLFFAQQKFFYSWMFLGAGFIPFPGAKLVLFVLFVNLVCVSIIRFVYKKQNIGILIIHLGLLSYFVSAYITYKVVKESNMTLLEQEISNVSKAYHNWEVAAWPTQDLGSKSRHVYANDSDHFKKGSEVSFKSLGLLLEVEDYFPNAQAYVSSPENKVKYLNGSGIKQVTKVTLHKEPEKNRPAAIVNIKDTATNQTFPVLLFGDEKKPTQIKSGDKIINIILRRKAYQLPFTLKLDDFKMEMHPGTQTAKSYESHVTIEHDGLKRSTVISMNKPLRFNDWTLYQASYSIDASGREYSTLAVVQNWGRVLPYVASLLTFAGLSIHFLSMALVRKNK